MVATANVENVTLQVIMRDVTFTDAVNREA